MNILKFESPVSQMLIRVADMIILNILYLLCSIPLFTIGAAQAGMFTAAKVMLDKEDDSSVYAAFFRGFKAGFGTITASWGLVTIVLAVIIWFGVAAYMLGASIIPLIIGASVLFIFQTTLPAFHSRFGSNFKMLLRNTLFFMMAYPLQCIGMALLNLVPLGLFAIMDLYSFLGTTPILALFYYSIAVTTSYMFLRKPFDNLIAEYDSTHGENK